MICKNCAGEGLKIVGGKTVIKTCDDCWYDKCSCKKVGHDKSKIPPLPPMSAELQGQLLEFETIIKQPTRHVMTNPWWWDWSRELVEEFVANVIWKFRLTTDDLMRIHKMETKFDTKREIERSEGDCKT